MVSDRQLGGEAYVESDGRLTGEVLVVVVSSPCAAASEKMDINARPAHAADMASTRVPASTGFRAGRFDGFLVCG